MVWLRFDDQFPIHRKVSRLSDAAFRLHVSALFWCARNLTDGVVPEEDLEDVCARVRTPERFVTELVKRGLWHEAGQECSSEFCPAPVDDGWAIHDYLEFQPSKAKVAKDRQANADRQRRWRERQAESSSKSNAVSNGAANALVTAPRPVPSRPEGTGTVQVVSQSSRRNVRAMGPDDDDSIDLAIVQLLTELTGRDVPILWASKVRQRILDGRKVDARMAYVLKSIRDNPDKFIPAADAAEPAPSLAVVPEWCGHCDERTRLLDLPDDTVARCPACHPLERRTA